MELKKRQQQELEDFRLRIEGGHAQISRVHYSNQVLDMEKKMQFLSASGQYADAKVLKKRVKQLKQVEQNKSMEVARQKLLIRSQALL